MIRLKVNKMSLIVNIVLVYLFPALKTFPIIQSPAGSMGLDVRPVPEHLPAAERRWPWLFIGKQSEDCFAGIGKQSAGCIANAGK